MYGATCYKGPATAISHQPTTSTTSCCTEKYCDSSRSQQSSSTRICLPCRRPGLLYGTQSSVLGCSSVRKYPALPSLVPPLLTRRGRSLSQKKLRAIRETSFPEATSDEANESRLNVVGRVVAADAVPAEGGGDVHIEVG